MSSNTRQQLEKWLGEIEIFPFETVLDIGGSQNPIQNRLKIVDKDAKFTILDLEQPHECKQKPDIIMDIQKQYWHMTQPRLKKFFDVAFCIEVSEYWYDPLQALRNISYFLKKEGILYISFHFIYPMHNPIEEDCLRYTRFGCVKFLEEAGFEIDLITPRMAEEMSPMEFYSKEKMRPTKGFKGHQEIGCLIRCSKI